MIHLNVTMFTEFVRIYRPFTSTFHRGEHVAVKIGRNIRCFIEVAKSEVAVLEEINGLDDDNRL